MHVTKQQTKMSLNILQSVSIHYLRLKKTLCCYTYETIGYLPIVTLKY